MPILSNSKHERFAQEVAQGRSASEAFVLAGYAKNDSNAARLNGNERVRARVAELASRAAQGLNVTLQWLIERAEEAREGAMAAGQHSAAVAAIKEIGILSGLRVAKREIANQSLNDISDDELIAILRGEGRTQH